MKLNDIIDKHNAEIQKVNEQTLAEIGQWIKSFYPEARTFEFEATWESNDEGGHDPYFSSLAINGIGLFKLIEDNPSIAEKLGLEIKREDYEDKDEFNECVEDEIRVTMYRIPHFVYERAEQTIA